MEDPAEFVLDGSVTMAWYFRDETEDYANGCNPPPAHLDFVY